MRVLDFDYGDIGVDTIMPFWLQHHGIDSLHHALRFVIDSRYSYVLQHGTDRDNGSPRDQQFELDSGLGPQDYTFLWNGALYEAGFHNPFKSRDSHFLVAYRNDSLVRHPDHDQGTGTLHTWKNPGNKLASIDAIIRWEHD
jgi:hypothetical protein